MHFLETLLMDIMKSEIIVPKYLNTLILPYWWADQLASTLLVSGWSIHHDTQVAHSVVWVFYGEISDMYHQCRIKLSVLEICVMSCCPETWWSVYF